MENGMDFGSGLTFASDGMIHAVQPMTLTPRGKQRAMHHSDSSDDPSICLNCTEAECSGSIKCYRRRKKLLEEKKHESLSDT